MRVERAEAAGTPSGGRARRLPAVLVVGTGMAAMATVEAALAARPVACEVTMVGREPDPPYDRVALSHLLAGTRRRGRGSR